MLKTHAINIVGGGSKAETARQLGISFQAVNQWPDELTADIENRVLAHLARKHLPPELLSGAAEAADRRAGADRRNPEGVDTRDPEEVAVLGERRRGARRTDGEPAHA